MKVLMINSVCGIRSTGRICTDLAEVLEANGHTCKIAYGRETVPEKYQKYAVRIGDNFSVKVDAFKTRLLDNAGFNSKIATKRFIEWVKAYDPDVIHLHNLHGYYINIEVLFEYLKTCGKKIIWTLHDCWAFTGHCSYYTIAGCNKWMSKCSLCPKKKAYPTSVILDMSRRNFNKKKALFTSLKSLTLVTPSEWLAYEVRQSFLGKYPVYAIPNGIDLSVFKPTHGNFRKKYNLEDKKIILGAATAWSERKGISLFSAISKLLDNGYKVVLVGITPDIKKRLPEEILTIERTNDVFEMAEIYTESDVFLNLGREETMGLTTVEAMACGTPVAVSNCTAVPEVVTSEGGVVIDTLLPERIIEAVEYVLSHEYNSTRSNAENYEKVQQYMKYVSLYEVVIKN